MLLVFYKENNSQDYKRDEFKTCSRQETIDKLSKLSDEELSIYDMDNDFDQFNFMCDYNDEVYDGGWWCAIVEDD